MENSYLVKMMQKLSESVCIWKSCYKKPTATFFMDDSVYDWCCSGAIRAISHWAHVSEPTASDRSRVDQGNWHQQHTLPHVTSAKVSSAIEFPLFTVYVRQTCVAYEDSNNILSNRCMQWLNTSFLYSVCCICWISCEYTYMYLILVKIVCLQMVSSRCKGITV